MLSWVPPALHLARFGVELQKQKAKSAFGGSSNAEGISLVLFCFAVGSPSGHDLKL